MFASTRILLGVCGSIAAYKSAYLARLLRKKGAEVQVLMTHDAEQFITPLTMSTLTGRPVYGVVAGESGWNNHVELGLWADVMLVAPVTAQTLAKMAQGLCDNMVTACYLSARAPVVVAPAMDLDMWQHPATQRNVAQLQQDGVQFIPVGTGELASGLVGPGRMAEPEEIVSFLENHFARKRDMEGRKVLITAGPTYEDLDPVRFLGNRSSGKMGLALAQECLSRGAKVDLVIGPTHLQIPDDPRLQVWPVRSASEMAKQAKACWKEASVAILAAAVADYRPVSTSKEKIHKQDDDLALPLERTEDIAQSLGQEKQAHQISVGFALETQASTKRAREKMERKKFDFIVFNTLNDAGAGFQHDTNQVTLLFPDREKRVIPLKLKTEVAADIVDEIVTLIQKKEID